MVQAESREQRERSGSSVLVMAEARAAEYTRRVSLGQPLRPKDVRAGKRQGYKNKFSMTYLNLDVFLTLPAGLKKCALSSR